MTEHLPARSPGRTTARHRPPGRPRREGVEDAILAAAIELLAERGLEATTMNAIIERSGVGRATVYLRWPTRSALITAAVRHAMGPPILEMTGDVAADLLTGAEQTRTILSLPPFQAVLPAFVEALTGRAAGVERISIDALTPGRTRLAEEYAALPNDAGIRRDVSGELVVDVVIGGLLFRYLATGLPPTAEDVEGVVGVVLSGVRERAAGV